jgi:CRISPR/Cas system CSM-associated protein Csm3 (group 7 of RAMP superfamily)
MTRVQHPIYKRIIVWGQLDLQTPAHFGNGDADAPTDMALQRDSISEAVLLTGSSIAGALRSYVQSRQHGIRVREKRTEDPAEKDTYGMAEILFGGIKGRDEGNQSPLIVCDALSEKTDLELRDGVKLDAETRTASEKAKYDLELLAAGTSFQLRFELAIPKCTPQEEQTLLNVLATALHALEQGEIGIGMKKRRGFGQCQVKAWKVWKFDLQQLDQLHTWLAFERDFAEHTSTAPEQTSIVAALKATLLDDQRDRITLEAKFGLRGSLIIRAAQDESIRGPDVRHLHTKQANGEKKPVLAGTSLAGVLRHRVERIANMLQPGSGQQFVRHIFGDVGKPDSCASRVIVRESVIQETTDLVQNRIAIDRFTGGAYDGALFNEQPIFGKPETCVRLTIAIENPDKKDIGMLLLLLKDLWTGDLPVGGESSIGRGRLQGKTATFTRWEAGSSTSLARLEQHNQQLHLIEGQKNTLQEYVEALHTALQQEEFSATSIC